MSIMLSSNNKFEEKIKYEFTFLSSAALATSILECHKYS